VTAGAAARETRFGAFRTKPHVPESIRTAPKKKIAAIALASILGAGAFAAGLLRTHMFAIERIDVTGTAHMTPEEVLSASGLKNGSPLISVDESHIEHALESNPWVEQATVTESWPHVVKVAIVERVALVAAQTTDNKWAQIGPDGVVLSVTPKPVGKLPVALDVKAEPRPGARLDPSSANIMTVAEALPDSLRSRVTQMQWRDGTMRLGLDAGTVVVIGDMNELDEKLMAAASVLSHTDPKTIETLDVRSPHLPVATPKNKSVPAATTATTAASKSTTSKSTTTTSTKPKNSTTTSVKTTVAR